VRDALKEKGRRRGEARDAGEAAGRRGQGGRGGGLGRPKVEERPDRWAPPVSWRERGRREVGQRRLLGRFKSCGQLREKKKRGMGWAAGLERRERRVWVLFFSLFSFSTLYSYNLFKFSKIILKTFKPHNHTKAHAFNMMHKHLGIN
jgi:hypothetical protein